MVVFSFIMCIGMAMMFAPKPWDGRNSEQLRYVEARELAADPTMSPQKRQAATARLVYIASDIDRILAKQELSEDESTRTKAKFWRSRLFTEKHD